MILFIIINIIVIIITVAIYFYNKKNTIYFVCIKPYGFYSTNRLYTAKHIGNGYLLDNKHFFFEDSEELSKYFRQVKNQ